MKKYPLVLDLETKYTFRQFTDPKKLGITVMATYDYKQGDSRVFTEGDLHEAYPLLENASYLVGYNIRSFDIAVLQGYYPGDTTRFAVFDILEDIRDKVGRRLALNDVVHATLGKKKSGHGLQAIEYYKEGRWDELKSYCLDDTMLTKELFDYGAKSGQIFYLNELGKTPIVVDWKKYLEGNGNGADMPLTLPF